MDNKEIIEQIKKGSKETIQAVYKQYAVDVYKFSKNITHDHDLAIKATEQTFLDLFTRIQKGETVSDDLRMEALKTSYIKAQAIAAEKKANEEAAQAVREVQPAPAPQPVPAAQEAPAAQAVRKVQPTPAVQPAPAAQEAPAAQAVREIQPTPAVQPAPEVQPASAASAASSAPVPTPGEKIPEPFEEETLVSVSEREEESAGSADPDYVDFRIHFPEEENYDTDDIEEENPVSRTQVIDISEAPEEGDRIFRENEEAEIREKYYVEEEEEEEKSNKGLFVLLVILNVILILLLLWLLIGLLVNLEVLPETIDIGYTWFSNHIYPIF